MNKDEYLKSVIKKNKASQIYPKWVKEFEEICHMKLNSENFLSVELSKKIKDTFFERIRNKKGVSVRFWSSNRLEEIINLLQEIWKDDISKTVILFSSVDEYIGSIQIPFTFFAHNILALWNVVKQDLCIVTVSSEHGLCLEKNFYNEKGDFLKEGLYEVSAWGDFEKIIT